MSKSDSLGAPLRRHHDDPLDQRYPGRRGEHISEHCLDERRPLRAIEGGEQALLRVAETLHGDDRRGAHLRPPCPTASHPSTSANSSTRSATSRRPTRPSMSVGHKNTCTSSGPGSGSSASTTIAWITPSYREDTPAAVEGLP